MDKQQHAKGPVRLSDISKGKAKVNKQYENKKMSHKSVRHYNHEDDNTESKDTSFSTNNKQKKQYHKHQDYKKTDYGIDINDDLNEDQDKGDDPHAPRIWQGTVTLIEVQKRNKERFNIYIDGEFAFGVSDSTLIRFGLHKDQELTPDQVNDIYQSERQSSAYNIAVRYLSHRLRSKKEVHDKLVEEEVPTDLIAATIEKLEDMNLVNDTIYGQSYTRTVARINRKGPSIIRRELKTKGLSEGDIELALDEYEASDQAENIKILAEKQYTKQARRHSMRESEQKTKSYLIQKGFDSDLIQQVLEDIRDKMADEDQESDALRKQLDKYWRKYQKLATSDRIWKIKGMMFGKGYSSEDVSNVLEEMALAEENNE